MNPQPQSPLLQTFPLHELAQIERALTAAQDYVATLRQRHDLLSSELERITRPSPPAPKIVGPGFRYRGEMVTAWSAIDIHVGLMRRLWTDFPEMREAMARAMGARGYSRAYIARTPAELFPGKRAAWAAKFSRSLVDGWVIDTNLNRPRIATLMRVAVSATALSWGKDVQAYWRATRA
ncbi:MAG: hypothetical protein Q7T63_21550 [Burkholderiaceae bacterium]|nr:hypothetical protein [Burkholderiaceae bacterium]MDP3136098.1 hypothetical protein [Burkholderiaceae bacterium]